MPLVEVVVGLAAAHDVGFSAAPARAVPYGARRARSRHCEVDMSACRCKNVLVSCMCRTMEMCVGVCIVGVHVRVLARARACVLRRRCRASLLTPETVRPFPSCGTTGRCREREAHRHAVHCSQRFFSVGPDLVGTSSAERERVSPQRARFEGAVRVPRIASSVFALSREKGVALNH